MTGGRPQAGARQVFQRAKLIMGELGHVEDYAIGGSNLCT
jgi:hypothetical protein